MTLNGRCVYYNRDIMREIYLFDPTFRDYFTDNFITNKLILKGANAFWYKKYMKSLNKYRSTDTLQAIKYILGVQRGFFDTVEQLMQVN